MIETSGERMAKANGLDLCYQTFGDKSDPALVLIMGLGTQMISWEEPLCAALARTGKFVVRFDNRDIGKSTRFEAAGVPNIMALMGMMAIGRKLDVPYTLRDMAADTVGLMDHLGIETAHVVGASMGGAIVQELAIHHRDRLRTMTCIMASTGDPRLKAPTAEAIAMLLKPLPADPEGYLTWHRKKAQVMRGPHFPEEEAFSEARARRNLERGLNHGGTTRQLAAIYASGNRTAALAETTTPALIIHGADDPLVPVAHGHALVKAIGRATVDIIPKMGHSLPRALWPRLIENITRHTQDR